MGEWDKIWFLIIVDGFGWFSQVLELGNYFSKMSRILLKRRFLTATLASDFCQSERLLSPG